MPLRNQSSQPFSQQFHTTHWSLVLAAGRREGADSDRALKELCEAYWYPLYAYARRQGLTAEGAQDSTQNFFLRLLEKDFLAAADPERGRFRSFLLTAFKRFLINEWRQERAAKRGGDRRRLSFDYSSGESRYALEPVEQITPERLYEREWVLTLLARVLAELRREFVDAGKETEFEALKGLLVGQSGDEPYAQVAVRLSSTPGAVKTAASRMRKRYRELLRNEIGRTVDDPAGIDAEIQYLFEVLGS